MTATQSSTARAGSVPKKSLPEAAASRFYARNGEVFMVGEQGGFCLSHAETERCLAHWRGEADREPWAQRMTEQMADELEAAMADAERQHHERQAA